MKSGPLIVLTVSLVVCISLVVVAVTNDPKSKPSAAVPVTAELDGNANPAAAAATPELVPSAEPERNAKSALADEAPVQDHTDKPLITKPPMKTPEGMVWIPGGTFLMGGQDEYAEVKNDELPVHEVELDGFYMDATEVTNAEFKRFVDATGFLTFAEKTQSREDYKGRVPDISLISEEDLKPASICFNPEFDASEIDTSDPLWPYHVWKLVKGANWHHPHGPDSTIDDKMDHPVVHVNYGDVMAYCKWAGKRLPTEAEWEYAARGGRKGESYPWGNERNPDGKWVMNIWQGVFPVERRIEDGYKHTSPVKSFPPNGYGLYDMSGNVWEWIGDYYRPDYYLSSPKRNPQGPADSFDPLEPNTVKRVQRGGSFMCNENYCLGYRVSSRMKGEEISGSFHCGFRCVIGADDVEKYKSAPRQNPSPR